MDTDQLHNHIVPETRGRTIPWASLYDSVVWLLSFGKYKAIRKATLELARIKPGDRVLDVGCGTGDLTIAAKALVGPVGEVHGIDAAPEMIDVAREKASRARAEVNFQVGLIESLNFSDGQFEVVLSSLMMHHLPGDLQRTGLAEIYRVLKPGGRVLIVDMESSSSVSLSQRLSDLMIQVHGGHAAMRDNVRKLIPFVEAAGFIAVETDKINRQFSFITGQKAG